MRQPPIGPPAGLPGWRTASNGFTVGRCHPREQTADRATLGLAIYPIGKIPAIVCDDGTVLVESNAILLHFAEGTEWLPAPGAVRTRCTNGCSSSSTATSPTSRWRNIRTWRRDAHLNAERLAECDRRGPRALDVMERRLAVADWLAGETPTVADLALSPTRIVQTRAGSTWRAGPAWRGGSIVSGPCPGSRHCPGRRHTADPAPGLTGMRR